MTQTSQVGLREKSQIKPPSNLQLGAIFRLIVSETGAKIHIHKMKLFATGCVFIAYLVHVLAAGQKECAFSVHGHNEKNSPILLHNDTSFLLPTNGKIILPRGEAVTLICPDPKNYILTSHSNISIAHCINGNVLRLANQDVEFSDIACKKVIRGSVLETTKKCGDNSGFLYKIGYPIMGSKNFLSLIDVCYNVNSGSTLYSAHLLYGSEIKKASKSNYRPSFSPEGLPSEIPASVVYTKAFQKSTLNRLLGSSKVAAKYINETYFLSRGHLSPDADFLYASWQYTTYYSINTIPQWQTINARNWKKVENAVRKLAENLRETMEIFTGTHGILTLADEKGTQQPIYLASESKLPVPQFVWKIVYSRKSRKAVVLVASNNPFTQLRSSRDFLCDDICSRTGWEDESWQDFQRGTVFCCDYREFAYMVKSAPRISVAGVLQGLK